MWYNPSGEPKMRILLLEPYCGGSHRAWAEGYATHSRHDVTLLTMPARFWKWRMQGGAFTLAEQARDLNLHPDLILASDILNLPAFLGLTRDFLFDIPTVLYCHENQLTYPCPPGEKRDLTYGMINWLSMLAADRVFFNSYYHMANWFEALTRLLKHFPDYTHVHRVVEVQTKAEVLPVGCDLRRFDLTADPCSLPPKPPLILWNQRWEYDKDPETFFRALYTLADERLNFEVALAGKSHHQTAPEFETAQKRLGEKIVHYGHADDATYKSLLRRADVVVSTALHEFFGIAVVEAIYCRCFPVLPHRLTYPELIPQLYHKDCLYEDFEGLLTRLRWALTHPDQARSLAVELNPAVARFDWGDMGPRYDKAMAALVVTG
jgi:glycosyltransferase involved in cell wall biosynthesis